MFKSLTIRGIYGREMFETWHKMLMMLQSGLSVRGVITHRLPAARYADGFAAMRAGEAGKVVLSWESVLGDRRAAEAGVGPAYAQVESRSQANVR